MNNLAKKIYPLDDCQKELFDLLLKRLEVVLKVGVAKKKNRVPALDKKRWNQVLESIAQLAREKELSKTLIKNFWEKIHTVALELEEDIDVPNGNSYLEGEKDFDALMGKLREEINKLNEPILEAIFSIQSTQSKKVDEFAVMYIIDDVLRQVVEHLKTT